MNESKHQPIRQVACMKWGTLYGADYVNHLYAMVRANLTGELRFVCMTDDTDGIHPEVECVPCPEIDAENWQAKPGWRKLVVYQDSSALFNLSGDWLLLDLDVVITESIDSFFEFKPAASFVVMENWTQPNRGIGNTSVVRLRLGQHTDIYETFIADPKRIYALYDNEQIYISKTISDFNLWPESWCQLYKVQCIPRWPMRFWQDPVIPLGCKIIAFPGDPNPKDALYGRWPVKKFWKKIYKYTKPAKWIKQIYQDSDNKLNEFRQSTKK